MVFTHDRTLLISSAGSRKAKRWPKQTLMWSQLVKRLETPIRGTEMLEAYKRLSKAQQDERKDVGGFVGGTFLHERRRAAEVAGRDIITLDLDNIAPGQTEEVIKRVHALGCAYALYSTRKHEPSAPRLRVLIPAVRTLTADEYEPCARKLGEQIGIQLCDPTTFEASRLMYWPSCCVDGQYVFHYADRAMLDPGGLLALYGDWRDVGQWPRAESEQTRHARHLARQQDPMEKEGIIGAFCRIYDIHKAVETFLNHVYERCDEDRYTYTGGSTTGGALVYEEGKFLFSHHATDPASGKLCNAYDLVRLHKFGHLDAEAEAGTPTNRLPSFVEMNQFAVTDEPVALLLNKERREQALADFEGLDGIEAENDRDSGEWMRELALSHTTGKVEGTANNLLVILENDPLLKKKMAYDEFATQIVILGALPWNKREKRRIWQDVDDAGLRIYIEKIYQISANKKLEDAFVMACNNHTVNSVKDYLNRLVWDGKARVDTLLTDYLGAEDNDYTRAVMRKWLVAAVARIMTPGVKFDTMPILSGPQGIGKSTFVRLLGKDWFSDSLTMFEGKEACELIQGTWINEIGELNAMSRSEINAVKQFLSRVQDIFRQPYGKKTGQYLRQCVFIGTTNSTDYLRDQTGARRFWPVDVGLHLPTKNVFKELETETDQIWAEAVVFWRMGEKLYFEDHLKALAEEAQEEHRAVSPREGIVREFVCRRVPADWKRWDLSKRKMYWSGSARYEGELVERDRICAVEVWCEALDGDPKKMKYPDAQEINSILAKIDGWERAKSSIRFGYCGKQRGFTNRNLLGGTGEIMAFNF